MGNKCCSKRPEQEFTLPHSGGYNSKKSEFSFNASGPGIGASGGVVGGVPVGAGAGMGGLSSGGGKNGSLDSRYTPDPNRGALKPLSKGGVDIIRPRTTPCGELIAYLGRQLSADCSNFSHFPLASTLSVPLCRSSIGREAPHRCGSVQLQCARGDGREFHEGRPHGGAGRHRI